MQQDARTCIRLLGPAVDSPGQVVADRGLRLQRPLDRWAARRAVRYGDGWYPNAASGNPDEYVPAFRKMAQEAGRDPKSLSLRLGGAPDDPDRLKRFRDMGIDAVNVTLMSETRDQLLPVLDHWAGHIRQLRG